MTTGATIGKFAAAAIVALMAVASADSHHGDTVSPMDSHQALLAWNRAMLDAVRQQNSSPGLASRNLAILHIAIFDALNASAGKPNSNYAFSGEPQPGGWRDDVGIISGAAHGCSQLLYPSERARFATLLDRCRSAASDPIAFAAGEQFGVASAEAILTKRQSDGASRTITFVPMDEVGKWRRTAPKFRPPELPHWKDVTPFVLRCADQFRPPHPPALDSEAYAQELAEVRELGARKSTSRSSDQTEIATFWSCFSYTDTPAGHWNDIAGKVLPVDAYSTLEFAHAFALLNIAMADAGIAAWDCKYVYRFWRPVQAVAAAADGAVWQSLLEAPPHPEYVSGHSTFTGAGCTVLQHLLGGDKVDFEVCSDSLPGTIRHYSSLSQAAEEIGRSRIYGGIHFQSGNREGLALGQRVATYIIADTLPQPSLGPPRPKSSFPHR